MRIIVSCAILFAFMLLVGCGAGSSGGRPVNTVPAQSVDNKTPTPDEYNSGGGKPAQPSPAEIQQQMKNLPARYPMPRKG